MLVPLEADHRILSVYEYWRGLVTSLGGLPSRRHLEPGILFRVCPGILPHICLIDVERTPLRFRMRLLGTAVTAAGGASHPGDYVDERDCSGIIGETLAEVVYSRSPHYREGAARMRLDVPITGMENVYLPFANDSLNVDRILSCTVFRYERKHQPYAMGLG